MIRQVTANHMERNYFNDYDEVRVDSMSDVTTEGVRRAIDKLVRRFKGKGLRDTMFVSYDDGTGYRLMYQKVGMESYEHPVLGTMYRGGHDALVLRHYTNIGIDSWDEEREVCVADAKQLILEGVQR